MFENLTERQARDKILGIVAEYAEKYHASDAGFKPGDSVRYAGRVYDSREMVKLADSCLDFWLTAGKYCDEFTDKLKNYLGVKYVELVNSGSSANLLAFAALCERDLGERRIRPGDEVITVAAGFPTTVAPIVQQGAIPVFADVTIPEYNIDVSRLEAALSDKTKAVFIAHTLGMPFDLEAVKNFCDKHGLWLIEDNCDALGSRFEIDGEYKFTGTVGDIGTSSFYPAHHMTTGEGGAVYTNNSELHKIMLSLRDWGRDCRCPSGRDNVCGRRFEGQFGELPFGYDHKYVYSRFGYNLKMTEMQAAVGSAQCDRLPEFSEKRMCNFQRLFDNLKGVKGIVLPKIHPKAKASPFGFLITANPREGVTREKLVSALEANNVQTRNLFAGNMIRHPAFDELRNTDKYRTVGALENTDRIMNDAFWIGLYPGMTDAKTDFMSEIITRAAE